MSKALKIFGWLLGIIFGLIVLALLVAVLVYPSEYVRRVLSWRESDVGDYLYNFPSHPLIASSEPYYFKVLYEESGVSDLFSSLAGALPPVSFSF